MNRRGFVGTCAAYVGGYIAGMLGFLPRKTAVANDTSKSCSETPSSDWFTCRKRLEELLNGARMRDLCGKTWICFPMFSGHQNRSVFCIWLDKEIDDLHCAASVIKIRLDLLRKLTPDRLESAIMDAVQFAKSTTEVVLLDERSVSDPVWIEKHNSWSLTICRESLLRKIGNKLT